MVKSECDRCTWRNSQHECAYGADPDEGCPGFETKGCPICGTNPCRCRDFAAASVFRTTGGHRGDEVVEIKAQVYTDVFMRIFLQAEQEVREKAVETLWEVCPQFIRAVKRAQGQGDDYDD